MVESGTASFNWEESRVHSSSCFAVCDEVIGPSEPVNFLVHLGGLVKSNNNLNIFLFDALGGRDR